MKVVGLVTEYNPFHNGHKYHIAEARRITGADYVIAVMSGNFVQRGAPAIIDKYSRTQMALLNGVDLVLELPVCFSTASAEYFAHGAVSLLGKLGVVDSICFGSECGDIRLLKTAAKLLADSPKLFSDGLQAYLKQGQTYPAARAAAMQDVLKTCGIVDADQIKQIINEPNNILGIEYIKAIYRLNSNIEPVTVMRKSAHYHDNELSGGTALCSCAGNDSHTEKAKISSATAIRNAILAAGCSMNKAEADQDLNKIKDSVPDRVYHILRENYLKSFPVTEEDFSQIIHYRLIYEDRHSLTEYMDVSDDMAGRIKNIRDTNCSIEDFYRIIKSKNLTLTRINRALLHIMLNIRKSEINEYSQNGYAQYARILGFRKEAAPLLRLIDKNSRLPIITKVSKAERMLDEPGRQMLSADINAAHLYNRIVYEKYKSAAANEYRHGICII